MNKKLYLAAFSLMTAAILAVAWARTGIAADKALPKEEDNSMPGWKMSWLEPGPAVVLASAEGGKTVEICVGLARAEKAGEKDQVVVVGGAIKEGKIPSAAEAAADTSLSGSVKITDVAGYLEWKAAAPK